MAPPGLRLLRERPDYSGDFKSCIEEFLQGPGVQQVYLPALQTRAWLVELADRTFLHIYEQHVAPRAAPGGAPMAAPNPAH